MTKTNNPHLAGLARQIADGANRRLTPAANPFSDRPYAEDVVGIDPITISLILALLQWVGKKCVDRAKAKQRHSWRFRTRVRRAVANCEATGSLPEVAQMAIASATADAVIGANDATIDMVAEELGWEDVA